MPKMGIMIASVRDGRGGSQVAEWFTGVAREHANFELTTLDLREWDLPMLREPNHPRFQDYKYEKTKEWSAAIDALDAFVIVTPEYDFSMPPALVNAIDHLFREWHYKVVGLVSYGGVSGGLRSAQMIKQLVTAVKMMPMMELVALPFFAKMVNADTGVFDPGEVNVTAAKAMLDEMLRWTNALAGLRRA